MGEYSARLTEFQSRLNDLLDKDLSTAGQGGSEQALTTSCYSIAAKALQDYCDQRENNLSAILSTLSQSTDRSAVDQQSQWQDVFSRLSSNTQSTLSDISQNITKIETYAPELGKYLESIVKEETQFYKVLARAPLGFFQGSVQQHMKDFAKVSELLNQKWQSLGDDARTADEKATATIAQVKALFTEITEKVVAQDRDITETLRNIKIDPSSASSVTGGLGVLREVLKAGVQYTMMLLEAYRRSSSEYVKQLSDAFAGEEVIVVAFKEMREVVAQFMEKTNLTVTISEFNESRNNALEMASQTPTTSLQTDATRFVENGFKILEPMLTRFKDTYENFVSANRGIFVGAVESGQIDKLLELSATANGWDVVEHVNIEQTLRELLDHSVNWKINLDGLDEEAAKTLKDAIDIELAPLSEGIVAANNDRLVDQFRAMVKDRLGTLVKVLQASVGGREN
jgi:hypothetical protein